MEHISNEDLFQMMDALTPEIKERVERRIQSNRKSKKAYNAKAYAEKKKREKAMKLLNEAKHKSEEFERKQNVKKELIALKLDVMKALRRGKI